MSENLASNAIFSQLSLPPAVAGGLRLPVDRFKPSGLVLNSNPPLPQWVLTSASSLTIENIYCRLETYIRGQVDILRKSPETGVSRHKPFLGYNPDAEGPDL
jgi:hypothetical protein